MPIKVKVKGEELQEVSEHFARLASPSFNDVLNYSIESQSLEEGTLKFDMRDELLGNPVFRVLHGGVISAILDIAGAHAVYLHIFKQVVGKPIDKKMERLGRISTIDLRIDYIRPGKGQHFTATSHILRVGSKIAVSRMELHNEDGVLIAVGTGTYTAG
ncbi:MAG: thioesterase family protein [Chloroflexota bacterium]|nr:thioesterase family protein [Chloroflexota bacterium]